MLRDGLTSGKQVVKQGSLMSSSAQLPATLLEWKTCLPARPRDIWNPLEEYFRSQGLTLWVPTGDPSTHPADRKHRAPDGFAHIIPAGLKRAPFFDQMVCGFFSPDTPQRIIRSREISTALQPLTMGDMSSFA